MKAAITIDHPGLWTTEEKIELSEWLKDQAKYILSDAHQDRSEGAARATLNFPPQEPHP